VTVAGLLGDHLDLGLDGARNDLGHLHAVGGDTEERRQVAHEVLGIEELVDTHLEADTERDCVHCLDSCGVGDPAAHHLVRVRARARARARARVRVRVGVS